MSSHGRLCPARTFFTMPNLEQQQRERYIHSIHIGGEISGGVERSCVVCVAERHEQQQQQQQQQQKKKNKQPPFCNAQIL